MDHIAWGGVRLFPILLDPFFRLLNTDVPCRPLPSRLGHLNLGLQRQGGFAFPQRSTQEPAENWLGVSGELTPAVPYLDTAKLAAQPLQPQDFFSPEPQESLLLPAHT